MGEGLRWMDGWVGRGDTEVWRKSGNECVGRGRGGKVRMNVGAWRVQG